MSRSFFLLGALLALAHTSVARGQSCGPLGHPLTEHTCFHASYGPFAEVVATPGSVAGTSTPNVDPVHTQYRVTVPVGASSVVTYRPVRSGAWVIFAAQELPVAVRDASGAEVSTSLEATDGTCPFFANARLVTLVANTRYTLVIPGSTATAVYLVLEKVGDFDTVHGRDADGDGYGDPADTVTHACTPPVGYVPNDDDCDDGDATVHPGALELCGDATDQDCDGSDDDVGALCAGGLGVCRAVGVSSCPASGGAPAVCSATPSASGAEVCNGLDDDCDGATDEATSALCAAADADRPLCVATAVGAMCGCAKDADCGGPTSGRLCFLRADEQVCIAGCVDGFGRNGCGAGMRCTSSDPESPGACVPTSADAGVDASADAGMPSDGGSGCACTSAPRPGASGHAAALGIALLVVVACRRASRLRMGSRGVGVLLALVATAGCYGAHGDDTGDEPDEDAGACVPEVGASLVAHACQHASLGPLDDATAAPIGQPSPDVSKQHYAYHVDLRYGRRVTYTASREGEHVIFVSPDVRLAILRDDQPVRATRAAALACDALEVGFVASLEQGATYVLDFDQRDAEAATLFVEHGGTFGDDAFARRCE